MFMLNCLKEETFSIKYSLGKCFINWLFINVSFLLLDEAEWSG